MNNLTQPARQHRYKKHKQTSSSVDWPQIGVYVVCFIIAISAAIPLWGSGIVNTRGGGDSPFLLQRTLEMAENIKNGVFPPRLMAHSAYEYGYPFFNHYGSLPYYLSACLTLTGFPITLAIQITQTMGFLFSALTISMWVGVLYKNRWSTIVATAAYTYAPFHFVNVYIRGDSLSEFYAFIWFPLILWALHHYINKPGHMRLFLAAVAYSGLILTHNTSAVAFSPFAFLYAVIIISHKLKRQSKIVTARDILKGHLWPILKHALSPFILGILITMWFWLPAVVETKYVQLGPEFTEGYFHHSRHYRGTNLIQPFLAFNYSIALEVDDAGPFAMGLLQTLTTGLGIYLLLRHPKRETRHQAIYLLLCFLGATWLITPLSSILWDNIGFLSITQFPWRFLSVQAVYTAALTAAIPTGMVNQACLTIKKHWLYCFLSASTVMALAAGIFIDLHPDRLRINDADVNWENMLLYETFTGNIGTTIRHEYLPADVIPRPYITPVILDGHIEPRIDGAGNLTASLLKRSPRMQKWHIEISNSPEAIQPHTVVFPLYYWPGWHARLDGAKVAPYPLEGSGQLAIDIVEGTHEIVIELKPTTLQLFSLIVSVFVSIYFFTTICRVLRRSHFGISSINRKYLIVLPTIFIWSVILPVISYRPTSGNAEFFDFAQMPYPHAGPIDFEVARLESSSISSPIVNPGDVINIAMQWSIATSQPLTGTLSLVSPAEHRHNVPYTLLRSEIAITPHVETKLQLPDELSRGLYLLKLEVYAHPVELKGHTAQGRTMSSLFIAAIRVPQGTKLPVTDISVQLPVLGEFEELTLHEVVASQERHQELKLKMLWSTPGTPRNWSLSLRLLDLNGKQITQFDTQPGYGYLPTSLWHADELIYDYLQFEIPEGTAPGDYTLRIIPYLQASMRTGGESNILIQLDKPTLYDLRNACCEYTRKGASILCQSAGIALLGLETSDRVKAGEELLLSAEWNAVQPPAGNISVAWSLVNQAHETLNTITTAIAPGSQTSSWPLHTWVINTTHLNLDPLLPPGTYQLNVTMQSANGLSETCEIKAIDVYAPTRIYTVTTIPHKLKVDFDGKIMLLGYDLHINRKLETLDITLWWQAESFINKDYKRFIHLYDTQKNQIMTQDDAMPRSWTYPTTSWDAGEIISETITLSLTNLPEGIYNLGIGWYDPQTLVRLQAESSDQAIVLDNRVTLGTPIRIR